MSCTREGFRQFDQETLNGAVLCFGVSGTFLAFFCHFCNTFLNLNQTSAAKNGAVEANATSPCPSTRASNNKNARFASTPYVLDHEACQQHLRLSVLAPLTPQ